MDISVAQLRRDASDDSDRLALATVVLDGELVVRNVRLIEKNGRRTIEAPPSRSSRRFLNVVEFISDDLRKRITEHLIRLYASMNGETIDPPS